MGELEDTIKEEFDEEKEKEFENSRKLVII